MDQISKIYLKPGKEAAIRRFHPWIFSGAIQRIEGNPREGDLVTVLSFTQHFMAIGHYFTGSIAVKIFSFKEVAIDASFWKAKLKKAYGLRRQLGLAGSPHDNAYRLVFSEGDGLPGLIIDYYNGIAVIQAHSTGMHRLTDVFIEGLREIYGEQLKAVYDKSCETLKMKSFTSSMPQSGSAGQYPLSVIRDQYLLDQPQTGEILETGHRFKIDWERGQKTGFFLDQRGNRMFAQFYAKNRKVLNLFCYSGAFSVYALKGGARLVHSVDSSKLACEWAEENFRINGFDPEIHPIFVMDAKKYLTETAERYDMIILDPPAFAKTHAVTNNALHAYIYINAAAIRLMNPGGILFTFSCSQAITREVFTSAILSAALEAGRNVRILHRLSQGPDHPVSIFNPEGEYLKGLILIVD
ncbi:MAG: class I SAM-dependent rRNA methyltransferase [Bacteroidales bacterium]|nr:class I SAM-dependent rRNA methyltransferase [Bacteroidales bacterium]